MPRVRASLLLNTISYVREVYGDEAHERVMGGLASELHAEIGSLREAGWVDVADLMTYSQRAADLLAQGDPELHRRAGFYSGQRQRAEGGFKPMLAEQSTAIKMASVYWHALFDTGSAEIVERLTDSVLLEIRDFPTTRELCLRIVGGLEGALHNGHLPARVSEETCSLDGHPHCVMRIVWVDLADEQ